MEIDNIQALELRLQQLQQQLKDEQNKTKSYAHQIERIKLQISKDSYDDVVWFHWKKANVTNKSMNATFNAI
jgi:hypothetical protein